MKTVARQTTLAILCLAGVVTAWQLLIVLLDIKPFILPPPGTVFYAFVQNWGILFSHLGTTMTTGLIGISISMVLAFYCAAVFASYSLISQTFLPFMVAIKNTPVVAIAPLVMLFLGRGTATGIVIVMIVSFLPMLVNCLQGFQAMNVRHLELMRLYAASAWQIFWKIRLPFALPYVFTGLRAAVPAAVLGALLAEWLTGGKGIGSFVLETASMRDMDLLWAGITLCMLASIGLFWITILAEGVVRGSGRVDRSSL